MSASINMPATHVWNNAIGQPDNIELCMKYVGVGLDLALQKDN